MYIRNLWPAVILVLAMPLAYAAPQQAPQETEQEKFMKWAKGIWDSLDRKTGEIKLPNGVATLKVPKDFYYLNPADTEKVLVEVWNNPPGQKLQGMLFPSDMTPFDKNAWGVTIDYTEEGYVADKDANDIDYDDILKDMKSSIAAENKQRAKLGYEKLELVGWASNPYYDKTAHKLHWAKEIRFGNQEVNTLNYNIRVLGRKGFLVLNFIAGMDQKTMIDAQLKNVLAMAEFNSGYRYEEFNPDIDTIAAYGIGGLVAGKVLAKTGLLAAALIFLKKFGIIIVVGIAALSGRIFKRRDNEA